MTVGWLTVIPYISGGVGLVTWGLVSDQMRAALEPAGGLRGLRDWADHRRSDHRLVVGDGGSIDRRVRVLWLEGTVLVYAADVPHGDGGGGFHCVDQLPRQSRRLLRPLVCRCDQGLDGQLCRWAVWTGLPVCNVRSRLRVVPSHPKSHRHPRTDCGARGPVNHVCD